MFSPRESEVPEFEIALGGLLTPVPGASSKARGTMAQLPGECNFAAWGVIVFWEERGWWSAYYAWV